MSRLDSHIRQKIAQRDSINLAAEWLGEAAGLIVEFGLGNGRSYSHLKERFAGREIFCFDRRNVSHPLSCPPASHLFLGEFSDFLADPALHRRFAGSVILVHLDIGTEDAVKPEALVGRIQAWLRPGAVVLSDQALRLEPAWLLERIDTTGQVEYAERYYVYRRRAG